MKRIAYLQILEKKLRYRLPKREINEIIRDYAEYFVEGERQGKTEEELSSELGLPEIVAKQLISDHMQNLFKKERTDRVKVKQGIQNPKTEQSDEKKLLRYLLIAGIIVVTFPLWGILLLVVATLIFALLLLVFSGVVAVGAIGIAGILGGIATLVMAVLLYGFVPNSVVIFLVLISMTGLFATLTVTGCLALFIRMIFRIIVKKKQKNQVSIAQDILDEVSANAQPKEEPNSQKFSLPEEVLMITQESITAKEVE